MGSSTQKIAISTGLLAIAGYIVFVAAHSGGVVPIESLTPSVTPSPTESVASPSSQAPLESVEPSATLRPPAAVATPTPVSGLSAQQSAILSAMNVERGSAGATALGATPVLQAVAQAKASDMAARGYFDHTSPDGVTFEQRIKSSGYRGTAESENLFVTTSSALDVVGAWMNSSGHRTNMLITTYVVAGVGIAQGVFQGASATYVVAVFGNRK